MPRWPARIVVVCLCVLYVSCATPYQGKGFRGGFSETQLSENVFRVYFRGNGFTPQERAEDFTLLRSAEVAMEHGYPYFIIVDENSTVATTGAITTPTQSYTTATATGVGSTAYGTAQTSTVGGHTFFVRKPSTRNTIACFKEKPPEGLCMRQLS